MIDKSKKLVLIGGGNFSAEIEEVANLLGYTVIGYIDRHITSSPLNYLGTLDLHLYSPLDDVEYFPAFGAIDRDSVAQRADNLKLLANLIIPNLVSPKAFVSNNVKLGVGSYIAHGVVINKSATLGSYVIINTNSTIGHNVTISDCTIISGNVFIGGGCNIGHTTLVGPGSTLLHNINIGSNVIISIGSVVGRSLHDGKTTVPVLSKIV